MIDFLRLSGEVAERDVEQVLMNRMAESLRQLGPGFTFVSRLVSFEVDCDGFYLDLLDFCGEQLRCLVSELKTGKFPPEFPAKLPLYVASIDGRLRRTVHSPTVGILICGSKNDHTVRHASNQSNIHRAVSTYTYEALPVDAKATVPATEIITAALDDDPDIVANA